MPEGSYGRSNRQAIAVRETRVATRLRTVERPTGKVVTQWRLPVPLAVMKEIFWQAAGPLIGDDELSAVMLAGMPVSEAHGMLVNLADTPPNRVFFGSTGTADDSSPFRSSEWSR